jgi:hypothetical protein
MKTSKSALTFLYSACVLRRNENGHHSLIVTETLDVGVLAFSAILGVVHKYAIVQLSFDVHLESV